jgi:hypothetical protein
LKEIHVTNPGYQPQQPLLQPPPIDYRFGALPPAPPAPPKKARVPLLVMLIAIAATALICGGGGIAIGSSGNSTTTAQTTATATATVTAKAVAPGTTTAPAAKATTTPKAKPTSHTLISFSGNGIKNSPKFKTTSDWTIHYSYNCANFGQSGNFAITYYTDGSLEDVAVNELKKKGSGTAPIYDDNGTHYLSVNSECSWKVSVTS